MSVSQQDNFGNVLESGTIEEHRILDPICPEVPQGLESDTCSSVETVKVAGDGGLSEPALSSLFFFTVA